MAELMIGGFAAVSAGFFTNPLDVVKTRMQLQGELKSRGNYVKHYRNFFHGIYTIAKHDGIFALQRGLVPALSYQMVMNGIRLGSFQVFTNLNFTKNDKGEISFFKSIFFGASAGIIGSFCGSPFYLVKIHSQAYSGTGIAVGHQRQNNNMFKAFSKILLEDGIKGLWRGVFASLTRVGIGSSVQLTTFTKCKEIMNKLNVFKKDSWLNILAASSLSGTSVVCMMTPFDVISTRLYNQPTDINGKGKVYTGQLDCFKKILKSEGVFGLYKGWTVSFMRLAPHCVLNLFFWNEFRRFYFSNVKN